MDKGTRKDDSVHVTAFRTALNAAIIILLISFILVYRHYSNNAQSSNRFGYFYEICKLCKFVKENQACPKNGFLT